MPKYYAVKNGREPGVYNSWDDCKAQTNGYSNAKFKSFGSVEEANQYMNGSNVSYGSSGGSSEGSGLDYHSNYSSYGHSNVSPMPRSGDRVPIYTDGACPHNGQGGARGGIGVHFPNNPEYDISEPLSGRQTNNRAEIKAAARALQVAKQLGHKKVEINTDSRFLIKSVNEWTNRWKQNDWKRKDGKDVINKEDFIDLEAAAEGMDVQWRKVLAHSGVPGNERADRLANMGVTKGEQNLKRKLEL